MFRLQILLRPLLVLMRSALFGVILCEIQSSKLIKWDVSCRISCSHSSSFEEFRLLGHKALFAICFSYYFGLLFDAGDGGNIFLRLHGIIWQKIEIFKMFHEYKPHLIDGRRLYRSRRSFLTSAFNFDGCDVKICNPFNWGFPFVMHARFVTILPITRSPFGLLGSQVSIEERSGLITRSSYWHDEWWAFRNY